MSRARKVVLGIAVWAAGCVTFGYGALERIRPIQVLLYMAALACLFSGALLMLDAVVRPRSERDKHSAYRNEGE